MMLKEYREKKNITQEKLDDISGIDRKTIFRIENDISIPKIDTYAKIVIALNMTDEEIGEHIRKIALHFLEVDEEVSADEAYYL